MEASQLSLYSISAVFRANGMLENPLWWAGRRLDGNKNKRNEWKEIHYKYSSSEWLYSLGQ